MTHSSGLRSATAALILLASSLHPALAANVVRGPYLQMVTPTNIVIKWRTDDQTDAIVRYGTATNALTNSSAGTAVGVDHEVILNGLTPATRYYYSIGDSVETLAGGDSSFTFQTAPTPNTAQATRIWVIGDSGGAGPGPRAVRDGFSAFTGNAIFASPFRLSADLWLMLGDNAYPDGTDSEYQAAVFDMYPMLLRQIPLWPTLGNHDGISADSSTESGPYYDIFSLPRNAEAGGLASGTEAYYSFDYGNIHFITLDSHETDRSVGGAMLAWLNNDLASTSKEWIIAFWHHPPYSKGSHDSDREHKLIDMRANAVPILESYGVDLVLTGHSHSYERSFLIDSHYGTTGTFDSSMLVDDGSGREDDTGIYTRTTPNAPNQGAVYAVVGSSSYTLPGDCLCHPVMYSSLEIRGSMVLDIDGNRLDAVFIDTSGSVRDYFSIVKGVDTGNRPPMFTSSPVTHATQGASYIYNITTTDPDSGDVLAITSAGLPGWLILNNNGDGTATLSGTPTAAEVGDHAISLRVTDASSASDVQNFTITVDNVNDAPAFTSAPVTDATMTEGQEYLYLVTTADPDLDAVTITATTLPAWLTLTDNGDGTGELRGTPAGADVGDHPVELQVQENTPAPGLTGSQQFIVTVTAASDGPVIDLNGAASITVQQGSTFNDPGATASDPQDGDLTAQIVVDNPVNTNVSTTYTVTYSVQDSAGNSAQMQRTVIVQAQSTGGGGASSIELFALFLLTLAGSITRRCPRRWGRC